MKSVKITAILILCGLALVLCGALYRGMTSGFGRFGNVRVETNTGYSLIQEREIPAEEVSSFNIKYHNFMDVVFYESADEDTILVREYLNFTPESNQLSRIETRKETLSIQGPNGGFTTLFYLPGPDGYTEIYLPAKLYDSFQVQTVSGSIRSELPFTLSGNLSAASTSGDITFLDMEAHKISVSSTSGDVVLNAVSGESVHLTTTSGDISARLLSGDSFVSSTSGSVRVDTAEQKLSVNTVSGDIRLEHLDAPFRLNTTSGEIAVEGSAESGEANTVSGDIRLFLGGTLSGNLSLHSTSGCIDLSVPETSSFYLDFDSTSGDCSTFFDDKLSFSKRGNQAWGQYGDSSENKLSVSTTSGSLRITRSH